MTTDLIIIGGGPAGYTAAFEATQLGAKVRLYEKNKLGGTCLQAGCIPTKTLLEGAGLLSKFNKAKYLGITCESFSPNFSRMIQRKNTIVQKLTKALEQEFAEKNIEVINEEIDLSSALKQTSKIIIATGTSVKTLPNTLSTDEILNLEQIPESIQIFGAGAVGLEMATLFRQLGSKVLVCEMASQLLPGSVATTVAKDLQRLMEKQGIKFELGYAPSAKNKTTDCELRLSCIGRKLNTEKFAEAGIGLGPRGEVVTNEYLQTNLPNVYAAGDITGKLQLAHVAYAQGKAAARNVLGGQETVDYAAVPFCVFTNPVFASVGSSGLSEEAQSLRVIPFASLGISQAKADTDGFLRLVIGEDKQTIIGVQLLGPAAAELISTATLIVQQRMTISDLRKTIWAHPTLGEIFAEA